MNGGNACSRSRFFDLDLDLELEFEAISLPFNRIN
jgi:hypothetical protein